MKVLLFSGGVESTCLLLTEKPDLALTIDYGQAPADGEVKAAKHLASLVGVPHKVVSAPLGHLGSGELTGKPSESGFSDIPEHWPFRNQMLVTLASMAVADDDVREFIIGTVKGDDVHSDGTRTFIDAMSTLLSVQRNRLSLVAPAIERSVDELVASSQISRDLLGWTFSCHRAPVACGVCRGCRKSLALFKRLDAQGLATAELSANRAVAR